MRYVVQLKGLFTSDITGLDNSKVLNILNFRGKLGHAIVISGSEKTEVIIGLGQEKDFSPQVLRTALRSLSNLNLDQNRVEIDDIVHRIALLLPPQKSIPIVTASLLVSHSDLDVSHVSEDVGNSTLVAEAHGIRFAKAVTNASGTSMNPDAFARLAQQSCAHESFSVEIVSGTDLITRGFPAIAAMGAGSPYEPKFIRISYLPNSQKEPIILVGKGVTFDTGGLSLKAPAAMAGMRHDICGAATVLSVMSILPELDFGDPVIALLPVIENMLGPNSIRPGDDIATRSGIPLRILDTDFEGRVIMADALSFASELKPRMIIDFSTLTYQSTIALGPEIAAFFCNDEQLANEFAISAQNAGEFFWRLPLATIYDEQIRTSIGLKNHPETDSGRAITAALLLQEFIGQEIPWLHIDATGPTWMGSAGQDGATGFGVSTLIQLLQSNSELSKL